MEIRRIFPTLGDREKDTKASNKSTIRYLHRGRALNTGPLCMVGLNSFENHSIVVAKLTNTVSSDPWICFSSQFNIHFYMLTYS